MLSVNDVKWSETLSFRLGTLGAMVADQYAQALAELGLKPKHVGVLGVLDAGLAASQLEIARLMRVAPSLVVSLADHLESKGAIKRLRDPEDRRRQILSLTEEGRELLGQCTAKSLALDARLDAGLTAPQQTALREALGRLAMSYGLPGSA
ncbi:MarR family winged helix-turn-helix transcriptional regulator [Streptomyces sp. NPDC058369]|uniref:MarR family winged helix-turn-helix transcriptional regulator n=1 Tax=unclassified Streptomyces TaxID=2593676 RepID=UPI002257A8EC|nr:MarR family transcriptional regulator [Streptomyces sp. NBC_01789]MCX4451144.1 MarR family transcriptional regulator [Streptomyces sp. NBC_01789]